MIKSKRQDYTTKYPYMGKFNKHNTLIVLFIDTGTGIVINTECDDRILGEFSDGFDESLFSVYYGNVVLTGN